MAIRPMYWERDRLFLLDQRELPQKEVWLELSSSAEVAAAIRDMAVRGAPAIGVAAAYGMALAARNQEDPKQASARLAASRPTAVNLFWALERIDGLGTFEGDAVLREAAVIEREDLEANLRLGELGADLVPENACVLTICNTGSLATAGHGTALGIIRTAFSQGKVRHVYACETRPRLQGLRLTAWELGKDGIPHSMIADGAAASVMRDKGVSIVIAGADRIARNGDTANKIGTYSLAVLADRHKIPFVIAAPTSTIDPSTPSGTEIPIEERSGEEITTIEGMSIAPRNCPVYNPAFDVTPGELISAIVTEGGVFGRPYDFGTKTLQNRAQDRGTAGPKVESTP